MNEYDYGDTVTMRVDFKVDDTLTDPTTVTLTVTDPSGDATSYTYSGAEVTKDATGEYSKALACSESGEWTYRWTGTGAVAAVGTKRFAIRRQGA
jgi:hypothetical protein